MMRLMAMNIVLKKIDYLDTAMENISLQVIQKGRFNSALVLTSPPQ